MSTGLPTIIPPTYQVPLTVADNYANNPFNTVGMLDPNLKHPRVQQYSIGVQHEFKGTVVEARYVGNHVVGAYRAFDFNQVVINSNGFLQDFLRAQKNGFLAQAAGGNFNPAYNSNIPGSQQLTVFPKLVKGALTDPNAHQLPGNRRSRRTGHLLPDQRIQPHECGAVLPEPQRAGHGLSDQLLQFQLQRAAIGS